MAGSGIDFNCLTCGKTFELPEPEVDPVFDEDTGMWGGVGVICPGCEEDGRQTIIFLNFDLPETEYDPQEIASEPYFPHGEKTRRQAVRKYMFKYRPDLVQKSERTARSQAKKELEAQFSSDVETIRKVYGEHVREKQAGQQGAPPVLPGELPPGIMGPRF